MHTELDLPYRHEAFLLGQEWMLLVGVDDLTGLHGRFTKLCWKHGGQGQIDQVVVVVDPHMQYRFQFHLARLGIVGLHLFTHMQFANWLLPLGGAYQRHLMTKCLQHLV